MVRARKKPASARTRSIRAAGAVGAASRTSAAIREMVRRIVERFDPERVILFGSHARGDAGADSDIDLLVVMDYEGTPARARAAIRVALSDLPVSKDVVVSTPAQFAQRARMPGTIERPASIEGKVLHARL